MKIRSFSTLTAALILAVLSMAGVYFFQNRYYQKQSQRSSQLWERQAIAQKLILSLERYRQASASFRKIGDGEIAVKKATLKREIAEGVSRLGDLNPSPEEKQRAERLPQQLADFMVLSAKLEPQLYTRDIFQKPEAQAAHREMLSSVDELIKKSQSDQRKLSEDSEVMTARLSQGIVFTGGIACALGLSILVFLFFGHVRPVRMLLVRANEIRLGRLRRKKPGRVSGVYAEIERALDELATHVDSAQAEKQNFVTAIATDLRAPLIPLQTSASLLVSENEKVSAEAKIQAADAVRRSVVRLSRTLDDLTDALQLERGEISLAERISDLREVMGSAAAVFNGPGASHQVRVFAAPVPIWMLIDPIRIERVLLHLISKMVQISPAGGAVDLIVNRTPKTVGQASGVEIIIQAGSATSSLDARAPKISRSTGPEQEVGRHWVSENGFSLNLASRVVAAHGGGLTASGVSGTAVIFHLKLPENRIAGASGLASNQPKSMAIDLEASERYDRSSAPQ